jgi:hypothetical protein
LSASLAAAAAIAVHVRVGTASAGNQRDVQLAVQVLASQKGRHARNHAGSSQGSADQLTSSYPTL